MTTRLTATEQAALQAAKIANDKLKNADPKALALAEMFAMELDDAQKAIENGDFDVLTDDEANDKVADYIKESLWAFRPEFLSRMTDIDAKVFEVLAKECEGANDAVLSLVEKTCGLQDFVDTAIEEDGRGHFLSQYDEEETEVTIDGQTFFIYRQN